MTSIEFKRNLRWRVTLVLDGIEKILEGLLGASVETNVKREGFWKSGSPRFAISWHVKKWHPGYWVGWVRCVLFKDRCGSAFYGQSVVDRNWAHEKKE